MKALLLLMFVFNVSFSQQLKFTKNDTLIGSNTSYRNWWDVKHYNISVTPNYNSKSITGSNKIEYLVTKILPSLLMQIDLQTPMQIDSLFLDELKYTNYKKENNRYIIELPKQQLNSTHYLTIYFSGYPKIAINPPWSGGWVFKKDSLNNPWMSVACQGDGASVWYPCKDLQSDEPDNGAILNITVPDTLVGVGNGKLIKITKQPLQLTTYMWEIKNPINSYNIIPYIGKYICLHDSINASNGTLITDYWILNYHQQKAILHLKPNVTKTLNCFENWFGPYPFYSDTYKIVEAPYLGMEHQSNVAYGNNYINGYAGRDLSKTGWGLKWDFIVVHETGHEWFGNSITATDVADNWIHEGFTSYSEVLFTECEFGKEAGNDYATGVRNDINNDVPLIGNYNVKQEGSSDIYNKGSNVIHTLRQIINDDAKFKLLLIKLNEEYYHKTVSTNELENFICNYTNIDFNLFFNQYLRTIQIPLFEYKISKHNLFYKYSNCINGFTMPLKIKTNHLIWIKPTTEWQVIALPKKIKKIKVDRNFYVGIKN